MRHIDTTERARGWIVDYSAARARAIEWLGDRYLLARPVNRRPATSYAAIRHRPSPASERS